MDHTNSCTDELEKARQGLLDLTLRNRALNYRVLKRRGLEVSEAVPQSIYDNLVAKNKALTFLPSEDEDNESKVLTSAYEMLGLSNQATHEEVRVAHRQLALEYHPDHNPENEQATEKFKAINKARAIILYPSEGRGSQGNNRSNESRTDSLQLQTRYPRDELQKRLLSTYRAARTSIQEQGINTLYLALGMLHWRQADSSQATLKAPLVLVPVKLARKNVAAGFTLEYTNEEVEENLSLREKLKNDFGIELPSLPDDDSLKLDDYFTNVQRNLRSQSTWHIDRCAAIIGFFTFSKFRMYRDLDKNAWPYGKKPCDHLVLRKLLTDEGFTDSQSLLSDEAFVDDYVKPEETFLVLDADSSQIQATYEVSKGKHLVIQGPPGAGKSQTITNLIAEATAQGKRVLFVAEKMAALEVVKRNLDNVGLGDACLELHSHKANKKALLEELERTLNLGVRRQSQADFAQLSLLDGKRSQLNAYAEAVNTPIRNSDVTPHQAYGEFLHLQDAMTDAGALPKLELPGLEEWGKPTFIRKQGLVKQLQNWCTSNGIPGSHPFWGSSLKALLPATGGQIRQSCEETLEGTTELKRQAGELAQALGLPIPTNRSETVKLCRTINYALEAPDLTGIPLDAPWVEHKDELHTLLKSGEGVFRLKQTYQSLLISSAWEQNLEEIRRDLAQYGHKWWRFLSRKYRQADKRTAELYKTTPPKHLEAKIAILDAVIASQEAQNILQQQADLGKRFFGAQWRGEDSNWEALDNLSTWVMKLQCDLSEAKLPDYAPDFLKSGPKIPGGSEAVKAVETTLANHKERLGQVLKQLRLDVEKRFGRGQSFESLSFAKQEKVLGTWKHATDKLQSLVSLNHLEEAIKEAGLQPVYDLAQRWEGARYHLTDIFDHTWYNKLLNIAFQERPALSGFDGSMHDGLVRTFRELDKLTLDYNRARVIAMHRKSVDRFLMAPNAQLKRYIKQRRRPSIRKMIEKTGYSIQLIKPAFMMSPISIAQFLPPGSINFDLVIFDEASQVRPADAFGAILRSKQVMVVGDGKQLPPTSFFDGVMGSDGDEDDDDLDGVSDLESILDVFDTRGAPSTMLRWHYRSRHESLIAVSNYRFYDNKLLIFPSPAKDDTGLVLHHHPETTYDSGKSRTNREEARIIAEAVMEHARRHPDRSLGVVAFSSAQMEAIEDALEPLRREDPSLEATFFNNHAEEPLFVKNLETVQGDERDTIFISVGYGRPASGRKPSMNFGPINKEGGWRRLNVLFTRARRRCEVFSNLTAEDINLGAPTNQGLEALKAFLAYAETGKLEIETVTGGGFDSPFEQAVYDKLKELGYEVHPQVGVAGYRIDLGVVDPEQPGRYILGIECDGATYHSTRSARDRDRLRQAVLEDHGWIIHRIWSTDWFRNPKRELERVVETMERAKVTATRSGKRSNVE